jgi:stage V sporulation protein D (sporulation-specific penicillin-binding protein)
MGKNGNKRKFNSRMQKKLVVLFIFVLLAFVGLGGRLVWISSEKGAKYEKKVLSQQQYDSTTIPYRRGDIVDAKGTKLATSEKVYNVIIDTSVMTYKEDYIEPTLAALASCFPDIDMDAVRSLVNANKDKEDGTKSAWYVALKKVSYEDKTAFENVQAEDSNIKGVWFEDEYKRVYPNGSLAADVIGFTKSGSQNEGQYGLEEYYNDVLNGTDGREYGYLNDDSSLERTVKAAVDGYTVHSTIDANIQSIVEKYLKEFNDEHTNAYREGNGAENLGCIIMRVNTGEVLAMASYPTYDLNNTRDTSSLLGTKMYEEITNANGYQEIRKTSTVINEEVLAEMSEDEIYLNLNNLWKNYCISSTYEPGSTAKPFTVAAALESGAITGDEVYTCNGYLEKGGHKIKCHTYSSGGEGAVSVQDSIAWSCNVALMKIGDALGKEEFAKFQKIFNFGLKTNIDLAGEARTVNLVYSADEMGESDLATNTFGQNFNVTMIQMITGFCSLINGGYYYEPHMVSKITNSSGATVENIEPRVLKQTVSESTSALIRQYTRATVMEEGGTRRTGKTARPAGYAIGGKTGTAETIPRGNKEYVVSFMGYAPADDPEIAIYVVVDRPNAAAQDDAKFATGIVRNILTEVLPYLNIFMTEELSESEIEELEEKQIAITTMYGGSTETENEAEGSENENTGAEEEQDTYTDSTGETTAAEPAWKAYPVDPSTGYRVKPGTGELFDAQTGEPLDGNISNLDDDVPVNSNIIDVQDTSEGVQ